MIDAILDQYNPRDITSHGILKFFSEDLNEFERNEFVISLLKRGSWILPIEISNVSCNTSLKETTKNNFYEIFSDWVNQRVEHSLSLPLNIKHMTIPSQYVREYREALLSIRGLDFPNEIMEVYERLINDCSPIYSKAILKHSFWLIVEEFESKELEKLFRYFSNIYISNSTTNLKYFLYQFLDSLAYSHKIFNLSDSFLKDLNRLSSSFKAQNSSDHSITLSILLIELIEKKKLDLSDTKYDPIIDVTYNSLSKGEYENLIFFKFLKTFNYPYKDHDFESENDALFENLRSQISTINSLGEIQKKATLYYFIMSSDQYFEFFLFNLEKCPENKIEEYFITFLNLIDELRKSFYSLLWYEEYLDMKPINGKIHSIVNGGFYVKISDEILLKKNMHLESIEDNEDESLNAFGFLSQLVMSEFPRTSLLYKKSRSRITTAEKQLIVENSILAEDEPYLISKLNYTKSNKGAPLTLVPVNKTLNSKILKYELKQLFPSVEIFLIEKAHEFLNLESPFLKNTFLIKKIFYFTPKNNYKLNFSEEILVSILKQYRASIYETIYSKNKNHEIAFEKAVQAYENHQNVTGLLKSESPGGMLVDLFGLEAFLPGSQVRFKPGIEQNSCIGKTMEFRIIKISPESKNVVLSNKIIIDEQISDLWATLKVGQVVEGHVKNITSYGAFVDLGHLDGLIHLSELSWLKITCPEEIVELGQKLKVLIIHLNSESKRIDLSLKQLTVNPWDKLNPNIKVGAKVKGRITHIVSHGIIIEVCPGVESLIHKSEFGANIRGQNVNEFKIGDAVEALITVLNPRGRKMGLSIKELELLEKKYEKNSIHISKIKRFENNGIVVEMEKGVYGLISDENRKKKFNRNQRLKVIVRGYDNVSEIYNLDLFDHWENAQSKYLIEAIHPAIVSSHASFGLFVELDMGITGLIHISKLKKHKPITHPSEFANVKDKIDVVILDVDCKNQKLNLDFLNFRS